MPGLEGVRRIRAGRHGSSFSILDPEVSVHARRSLSTAAHGGRRSRLQTAALSALVAAFALTLVGAGGAGGVAAPRPAGPPSGGAHPELPPFLWRAARGADSYEFQIAADRGFNSTIPGLRNTRFD